MRSPRWTPEAEAWMRKHYADGTIDETAAALEERFGVEYSRSSVFQKAARMGLRKRNDWMRRAERAVRWCEHPDWLAFIRENDTGTRLQVADAFEAEFGVRLTPQQVSAARAALGTAARRDWSGAPGMRSKPVGTVRETGKGYALVKVRERPSVPRSKDNWVMRHVLAYEEAFGPVPDGCEVVHADGDNANDDPANLVAVPKSLVGIINQQGLGYHDRESLEACVAVAKLKAKTRDVMCRPRRCALCGREFAPPRGNPDARTCPECVKAGHRWSGEPRAGDAVCERCGRKFAKRTWNQRLCHECSSRSNGRARRDGNAQSA